jgi:hypothetical protein
LKQNSEKEEIDMKAGPIDDNGELRGEAPTAPAEAAHSGSPVAEGAEGPSHLGDEGRGPRRGPAAPRIDPEFKALNPPLSPAELEHLEQSILQEGGARHALSIWNGTLLDGHNRLAICEKHNLPYRVEEVSWIKDRADAKIWIMRNQIGQRNLARFARIELACVLQPLLAERARANQVAAGGAHGNQHTGGTSAALSSKLTKAPAPSESEPRADPEAPLESASTRQRGRARTVPVHTRAEIAKIAGVSEGLVYNAMVILDEGTESQKESARSGKRTINAVFKQISSPKAVRKGGTSAPPPAAAARDSGEPGRQFPEPVVAVAKAICRHLDKREYEETLTQARIVGDEFRILDVLICGAEHVRGGVA